MQKSTSPLDYLNALDRYKFLTILNAANEAEEHQFVKQACLLWLVNYSGDLYVQFQQAQNYANLGMTDQAISILKSLVELDPQFIEAYQALGQISSDAEAGKNWSAIVTYLTEENQPKSDMPEWLAPLWDARQAYTAGEFDKTNQLVHQSLLKSPDSPLPAILHLKAAYKSNNAELLNNLSEIYYQQWPNCLQVNIIKSLSDLNQGSESEGVERLHWVAAHDSTGQVIQRLLGPNHRFKDLWPDEMEIFFDLAVPAPVANALGWNQLASGGGNEPELETIPVEKGDVTPEIPEAEVKTEVEPILEDDIEKDIAEKTLEDINPMFAKTESASDEEFEDVQRVFTRLAKRLKKTELERADNRFPIYVIMSSKSQLESQYGPNTAEVIDGLLQELAGLVSNLADWNARVFYPDDAASLSQLGLKPTVATDAWKVKLSLADLDKALAARGEMIGSLLIVGGPEIVPFHQLPNPTLDDDLEVASDNPYGTIDENYFIPQWPVGRLPGETGSDAGLLLYQIRQLIYRYEKKSKKGLNIDLSFNGLFGWLLDLLALFGLTSGSDSTLGLSAEVWQEASAGVYNTIGKVRNLLLSPPTNSDNIRLSSKQAPDLGYFNLHGTQDGPNWYGQKDFSNESTGPDYPIALSPKLFNENVNSPKYVFSEACYGANFVGKAHDDAMSLKFLDTGTNAFVGSTCIAYGSITMPLIAADYLAQLYWKQILEGDAAGYALMRAKLTFAQEMTRKQGFLDGEDQKTLLSFVLYGDPLAAYEGDSKSTKLVRVKSQPAVKAISDSDLIPTSPNGEMPKKVTAGVKEVIEKYLPGLENAQMKVVKSKIGRYEGNKKSTRDDRYFVTLEKSIQENPETTHHHFARMTFDKRGKLVKFSTSR
jgi:tetratricopeptide (TPR) repeat protein